VIKPRLGDTIRYIDYSKIDAFDMKSARNNMGIFLRWHDEQNIVVAIDGVEKVISAGYLI